MHGRGLRSWILLLAAAAMVGTHALADGAETEEPEAVLVYESGGDIAAPGQSTEAVDEYPPPLELQLGGYVPSFSTELRVDVRGEEHVLGREFSFEEALGLAKDERLLRLDGRWRVGRKSRIGFAYYWHERSSEVVLEEDVEWGDETFPAGAGVAAAFRTRMLILNYQQTLTESRQWDVAGSLGLHVFSFTAAMETIGEGDVDVKKEASVPAPLPMIGLDVLYRASPQWRFGAKGEGLAVDIGDYTGRWVDLGLTAEYFPAPHWAIGLGLNDLRIDLSADNDSLFGELEYEEVGLRWFVTWWL